MYIDPVERAATLQYRHVWLDWRKGGIAIAAVVLLMAALGVDIAYNDNSKSWGLLLGCGIGLLWAVALALLDVWEYFHMRRIYARIRTAALRVQTSEAKTSGQIH